MSGVVAKMFIQQAKTGPDGTTQYDLGVVCRGEENKDWAAATPSGSAVLLDPVLDRVWAAHATDPSVPLEVLVYQTPDPDGEWVMHSCDFAYNGCIAKFHRPKGPPYGLKLELTVNAKPASKVLRDAYAAGLDAGEPPRFTIRVANAVVIDGVLVAADEAAHA